MEEVGMAYDKTMALPCNKHAIAQHIVDNLQPLRLFIVDS